MDKLFNIAQRRLHHYKLGESSQASYVLFEAQKFLRGYFEEDPGAVLPLKLQRSTLWLKVKNASVAQELQGISPQLLTKLKKNYGALVEQIRITYR